LQPAGQVVEDSPPRRLVHRLEEFDFARPRVVGGEGVHGPGMFERVGARGNVAETCRSQLVGGAPN
jgi:hypothetical protein